MLIAFLLIVLCVSCQKYQQVVIIGTNDIHGSALPSHYFQIKQNKTFQAGGLQYMAQMIQTIKQEYKGNYLYLDAGDQWQGGVQSSRFVSSGKIINEFFNYLKLDAWAIGNHQFDETPDFLDHFIEEKDDSIPELTANLKGIDGKRYGFKKLKDSKLFTLQNGIKIGIVGLTTRETTELDKARQNKYPEFVILPYAKIVRKLSAKLRLRGANAVFLLAHVGNNCTANQTFGFWKIDTPQQSFCDQQGEISRLLREIPRGTIDGIIQGHMHVFSHHFIQGIPVMGTTAFGKYFNIMHLNFSQGKLVQSVIEGPIPVCKQVFEKIRTCSVKSKDKEDAGELVDWYFHNKKVEANPYLQNIYLKQWMPQMAEYSQKLVINKYKYLQRSSYQCELGNLFTNMIHSAYPQLDVVFINYFVFRTVWFAGILEYRDLYDMIPYTNDLVAVDMTGEELLRILQKIQTGNRAYYMTYGLQQIVKEDKNKRKTLLKTTFTNGEILIPNETYRVGTLQFFMNGEGQFSDIIGKLYTPRNLQMLKPLRDVAREELIKLKTIGQVSLIDPNNRRLLVVRPDS